MSKRSEYLSPKDAAARLGVAPNLVYQSIQDGRLRAQKDGWYVLIRPADLETFKRSSERNRRPSARRHAPQKGSVGERLREIREARELTQEDLAARFDVSQSTIKNVELGLRRVSHEMLFAYAKLGGVSIDWILAGKD